MNEQRNLITAILLSVLIIFGGQWLGNKYFPQPKAPVTTVSKDGTAITKLPDGSIASQIAVKPVAVAAALADSGARVAIETPKLSGSINLTGAKFDDLLLLAHRTDIAKDSPPVRLFAPSGTADAYFARFGWVGSDVIVPDDNSVWAASGQKLTPETPITLSWSNPSAQKFEIVLSIDKDYLITALQRFTNSGAAAVQVAPYGLVSRNGKSKDHDSWNIHVGPMGVFDDKANYSWNYDDVTAAPNGETSFQSTGGWIGFTDKYWLAAMIPDQKIPTTSKMRSQGGVYQTQMIRSTQASIAPGATSEQTSRLFAGAKEITVLDHYTDDLGIKMLDYSIDWGWFRVIEKGFFWILHKLFTLFGNFGFAILGLTLVVRAFMFPIAHRQFSSMAQMRVVQPKMKALQERWKDDKPRQQQEIMKLYKEEKVNPLAGCLPIVLQIPIFFSLYKLLMLTIEMRHQPFLLWIKDLSVPDPSTAMLFHSVGITLPAFLAIGVLPILLGITMWMMQRLNPQPMDDVQKQVFAIMPFMMTFMFAGLASGLQIYYVFSNILSILQQKWLYSRHPILKQQMAKDAVIEAEAKSKA